LNKLSDLFQKKFLLTKKVLKQNSKQKKCFAVYNDSKNINIILIYQIQMNLINFK